jgi:hypothetical protein
MSSCAEQCRIELYNKVREGYSEVPKIAYVILTNFINPRRTCAERVTVVVLCLSVYSLARQPLLHKKRERVWWKGSHYCVPTLKIKSDPRSVVT